MNKGTDAMAATVIDGKAFAADGARKVGEHVDR